MRHAPLWFALIAGCISMLLVLITVGARKRITLSRRRAGGDVSDGRFVNA